MGEQKRIIKGPVAVVLMTALSFNLFAQDPSIDIDAIFSSADTFQEAADLISSALPPESSAPSVNPSPITFNSLNLSCDQNYELKDGADTFFTIKGLGSSTKCCLNEEDCLDMSNDSLCLQKTVSWEKMAEFTEGDDFKSACSCTKKANDFFYAKNCISKDSKTIYRLSQKIPLIGGGNMSAEVRYETTSYDTYAKMIHQKVERDVAMETASPLLYDCMAQDSLITDKKQALLNASGNQSCQNPYAQLSCPGKDDATNLFNRGIIASDVEKLYKASDFDYIKSINADKDDRIIGYNVLSQCQRQYTKKEQIDLTSQANSTSCFSEEELVIFENKLNLGNDETEVKPTNGLQLANQLFGISANPLMPEPVKRSVLASGVRRVKDFIEKMNTIKGRNELSEEDYKMLNAWNKFPYIFDYISNIGLNNASVESYLANSDDFYKLQNIGQYFSDLSENLESTPINSSIAMQIQNNFEKGSTFDAIMNKGNDFKKFSCDKVMAQGKALTCGQDPDGLVAKEIGKLVDYERGKSKFPYNYDLPSAQGVLPDEEVMVLKAHACNAGANQVKISQDENQVKKNNFEKLKAVYGQLNFLNNNKVAKIQNTITDSPVNEKEENPVKRQLAEVCSSIRKTHECDSKTGQDRIACRNSKIASLLNNYASTKAGRNQDSCGEGIGKCNLFSENSKIKMNSKVLNFLSSIDHLNGEVSNPVIDNSNAGNLASNSSNDPFCLKESKNGCQRQDTKPVSVSSVDPGDFDKPKINPINAGRSTANIDEFVNSLTQPSEQSQARAFVNQAPVFVPANGEALQSARAPQVLNEQEPVVVDKDAASKDEAAALQKRIDDLTKRQAALDAQKQALANQDKDDQISALSDEIKKLKDQQKEVLAKRQADQLANAGNTNPTNLPDQQFPNAYQTMVNQNQTAGRVASAASTGDAPKIESGLASNSGFASGQSASSGSSSLGASDSQVRSDKDQVQVANNRAQRLGTSAELSLALQSVVQAPDKLPVANVDEGKLQEILSNINEPAKVEQLMKLYKIQPGQAYRFEQNGQEFLMIVKLGADNKYELAYATKDELQKGQSIADKSRAPASIDVAPIDPKDRGAGLVNLMDELDKSKQVLQ